MYKTKLLLLIPVLFLLAMISSTVIGYSNYVIVKNYPVRFNGWNYEGLFVPPNIIIINGYTFDDGNINEHRYRRILVHEYAHYLCYDLFGDFYCNDEDWKEEHENYNIKI